MVWAASPGPASKATATSKPQPAAGQHAGKQGITAQGAHNAKQQPSISSMRVENGVCVDSKHVKHVEAKRRKQSPETEHKSQPCKQAAPPTKNTEFMDLTESCQHVKMQPHCTSANGLANPAALVAPAQVARHIEKQSKDQVDASVAIVVQGNPHDECEDDSDALLEQVLACANAPGAHREAKTPAHRLR